MIAAAETTPRISTHRCHNNTASVNRLSRHASRISLW